MTAELIFLRLVHILGATFWLGSGLFTTFFLVPALGQVGPAGAGPVMGALKQRRLFTVLPVMAMLTILSGARLLHIASGGFGSAYLDSRMGQTFVWSGVASVVAFVISTVVVRPATARIAQLGVSLRALPDSERPIAAAELERLRRRTGAASTAAVTLLIASAMGMAVARYLG